MRPKKPGKNLEAPFTQIVPQLSLNSPLKEGEKKKLGAPGLLSWFSV